jgi:hypothetical protein
MVRAFARIFIDTKDLSLLSTGFARLFRSSFSLKSYICNISGAYC